MIGLGGKFGMSNITAFVGDSGIISWARSKERRVGGGIGNCIRIQQVRDIVGGIWNSVKIQRGQDVIL